MPPTFIAFILLIFIASAAPILLLIVALTACVSKALRPNAVKVLASGASAAAVIGALAWALGQQTPGKGAGTMPLILAAASFVVVGLGHFAVLLARHRKTLRPG